jgi:hypothetical protein
VTEWLHELRLTRRHRESGIAMTMSLDYTLLDVKIPIALTDDRTFAEASQILGLVASELHKAVSKANLDLAPDIAEAVRGTDG